MSYLNKNEYEISLVKTYKIIRRCPKCGDKTNFINTNHFRVNANGKYIDVWLIYHCEKCKHTYNLTIYERIKSKELCKEEYAGFMNNDVNLAIRYGINKQIFSDNKAEINLEEIIYEVIKIDQNTEGIINRICIHNPNGVKVRVDRILSEILEVSRSKINDLLKNKIISCQQKYVGKKAVVLLTKAYYELK